MSTSGGTEPAAENFEQSASQFVSSGNDKKALQKLQEPKAPGSRAREVLEQLREETPPIDDLDALPEAYTNPPTQ